MNTLIGAGFFLAALVLGWRWYVAPRLGGQKTYDDYAEHVKALKRAEREQPYPRPQKRQRAIRIPLDLNTAAVLLILYAAGAYTGLIPFDVTAREDIGVTNLHCEYGWLYPWPPGSFLFEKERGDYYYAGDQPRGEITLGALGYDVHNLTTGEHSYHPRMYCTVVTPSGYRPPGPSFLRRLVTRLLAPYDARLR